MSTTEPASAANDVAVEDDVDAAILWSPSPVTARGIVALIQNVTGDCVLGWGDGQTVATAGGAPALPHTYASAGAYKLTVRQNDAIVAEQQITVRDGLAPAVSFAPDASNPNLIIATVDAVPEDLVSRYRITWETGKTETQYLPKGSTARYGFKAGKHTVVVRDLHTKRTLSEEIEVKDKEYDPDFTVAKGADTMTADATISKLGTAKAVLFDWGDGTQDEITSPTVGTKKSHTYLDAETYIVQLVYKDGSTEGSAKAVTVPFAARAADDVAEDEPRP